MDELRLPVPKSLIWNQSNPYLNTNDFDDFGKLPSQSGLLKLYNLSTSFLGLGLYIKEDHKIAFLSGQDHPIQDVLLKRIQEATKRRQSLLDENIACRLVHHHEDLLSGVVIEKYGSVFFHSDLPLRSRQSHSRHNRNPHA